MNTETNPAEPEVEVEEAQFEPQDDEGSADQDDADNPDEETEEAEPETVEIERDGKKFKVPVALKDDFLRQSDYTRKTQEIAAERKALDEAKQAVQQAGEAEVNARARSVAIDAALKQYENVDWDALQARDANLAFEHWRKFQQLQTGKVEADREYETAKEARTLETHREAEKRIEQGIAELQQSIPDWGPEKAEQLISFGESVFKFSRAYMESVDDPNLIKVMNYAYAASKNQSKPVQLQPKPAAKVKEGSAPRKGLDDRLSAEDWVKARNAQVGRK